jgi:hypothetical protein
MASSPTGIICYLPHHWQGCLKKDMAASPFLQKSWM